MVRAFNYVTVVGGRQREMTVLAFDKFTIPDDKCLMVEMFEKNGGRHQSFTVHGEDLVRARTGTMTVSCTAVRLAIFLSTILKRIKSIS